MLLLMYAGKLWVHHFRRSFVRNIMFAVFLYARMMKSRLFSEWAYAFLTGTGVTQVHVICMNWGADRLPDLQKLWKMIMLSHKTDNTIQIWMNHYVFLWEFKGISLDCFTLVVSHIIRWNIIFGSGLGIYIGNKTFWSWLQSNTMPGCVLLTDSGTYINDTEWSIYLCHRLFEVTTKASRLARLCKCIARST